MRADATAHGGRAAAAWRALRPYQWAKNLLVFVPLLAAHRMLDLHGWLAGLGAFAALSAVASAQYLVNDMADVGADRAHPRKRRRPFASGALPLAWGWWMSPALAAAGLGLAAAVGALAEVAVYGIVSLLYTVAWKRRRLVDVFCLAGLYTLRLFVGGAAAKVAISSWLSAFSIFLFLSLAMVKRVAELDHAAQEGREAAAGRGYLAGDIAMLKTFGVASSFVSAVVLALYSQEPTTAQAYRSPQLLMLLSPLMLFWQCRVWLLTQRGEMDDDPLLFALRDHGSWKVGAMAAIVVAAAALLSV